MAHYVYGSGLVGCLFDNGPHFTETKEDAIESALCIFTEQLPETELNLARENLHRDGFHYFSTEKEHELYWAPERRVSARELAGADYVEVSLCEGPCPEEAE